MVTTSLTRGSIFNDRSIAHFLLCVCVGEKKL